MEARPEVFVVASTGESVVGVLPRRSHPSIADA